MTRPALRRRDLPLHPRHGSLLRAATLAVGLLVLAPLAASPASAAPATRDLGATIDAYAPYDGESACDPSDKPGVQGFRDLVLAAYPGQSRGGISRPCTAGRSEHEEGRAWDFPLDARDPADRAVADDLLGWLLATDAYGNPHANMRRLGIMYVIWDRRTISASGAAKGWQPYTGSSPHTDHIHVSFSRAGAARQTSWWTGPLRTLDPVPGGRDVADACPAVARGASGFVDTAGGVHAASIDCVAWWGIAKGREAGRYDPEGTVTRAQMASFLARLLEETGATLPQAPPDAFRDDDALPAGFRLAIDQLAAVGVVKGTGSGTYDPAGLVTRGQMTSFLARAVQQRTGTALPVGGDYFGDVDPATGHGPSVSATTRAGIVTGTGGSAFSPARPTTRGQMATFLSRTLDQLVEQGAARLP